MRVPYCLICLIPILLHFSPTLAEPKQSSIKDAVVFIRVEAATVSPANPSVKLTRAVTEGSGFLINKFGDILTARHIIKHSPQIPGEREYSVSLIDRNAKPIPAQTVACENEPIDICLIKISESSVRANGISQFFKLSCRKVREGEKVTAYGFPVGKENPVLGIPGDITSDDLGDQLKIMSNVQIIPGMSGGPVLDNLESVIALNAGAAEKLPTWAFLQPLQYLRIVTCQPASEPARETPVTQTITVRPGQPCDPIQKKVGRTQYAGITSEPMRQEYTVNVQANLGCRVTSVETKIINSGHLYEKPKVILAPDKKAAAVIYSLESGTFNNRYRGFVEMELVITQEPNT